MSATQQETNIVFVVLGKPQPLKRHRMFRMGKRLIAVDPSRDDKENFAGIVQKSAPDKPLEIPLSVEMLFYFPRPKSHSNKNGLKPTAPDVHTSRPDVDNLIKFVMDGLNGIFWKDDALICKVSASKYYSDQPRTEVCIKFLPR